jgi:hypothetical protein
MPTAHDAPSRSWCSDRVPWRGSSPIRGKRAATPQSVANGDSNRRGVHGVVGEQLLRTNEARTDGSVRGFMACGTLRVATGIVGLCLLAGLGGTALAQENKAPAEAIQGPALKLELNRLEPAGEACRTYLLVDNSRGPALKSLKVDLFAFDTEGVAQKRLAVELGPVPDRKTMVRLFDFPALACPKIGRVLLNDVIACEGGDATRENCLARIEPESKTATPFVR